MSPPTIPLLQNHPYTLPIGLGFGSLSGFYGPPGPLETRLALLDHAHANGLRFWDLADVYGDSEDLVGEWFRTRPGKRADIFLATKFSLQRQADGRHTFRSDPEYVKIACERSLERLGVEYIDLYYCHRVDGVTPIERTVEAMGELRSAGKINHLGLSEVSASTLRRAHATHHISALQMEYSLFTTDIDSPGSSIHETCRALNIPIIAFSPLGRGVLSGQFTSHTDIPQGDLRRGLPKYAEENFPQIRALVKGLDDVAEAHSLPGPGGERRKVTAAQVALAWLLAKGQEGEGAGVIPIPGTKSVERMDENAGAVGVELSEAEVRMLGELRGDLDIKGTRYSAAVMATLLSDTPELE
ncbi:aldo/keto reductase [Aspergillus heteromorphus CBS 117.55]|uniref:Aldo/keto reductase n=1 Tax=Aspergillus heteromorphus CBS 117.55 TaxID=1448321 RepID=A0A317WPJ7_9EURO|nr:aldo/keto reductase [Aspergillus heteromorphus CBS 117.55]PWY88376.1 aldo/keto reductase [Aspergillus heteromorphus CBS 117.55]